MKWVVELAEFEAEVAESGEDAEAIPIGATQRHWHYACMSMMAPDDYGNAFEIANLRHMHIRFVVY